MTESMRGAHHDHVILDELADFQPSRHDQEDLMADVPVERLQAAIRLLFPEEMTPTAKRVLEAICDAASDVLTEYYVAELLRSDPDTIHDVAGPCEWNYHRGIPDGSRCRCGKLRAGEGAS